jgi:excisionase family DNA binding protein
MPLTASLIPMSQIQENNAMHLDLLTAVELAELLRVRPGTVRQWAREGRIPAVRISPKVVRFCYPDVLAALKGTGDEPLLDMDLDLLNATELADLLGVQTGTVRQWAREEIIPITRTTRNGVRFCYDDVLAALREHVSDQTTEWFQDHELAPYLERGYGAAVPPEWEEYMEQLSPQNSEGMKHD